MCMFACSPGRHEESTRGRGTAGEGQIQGDGQEHVLSQRHGQLRKTT